jgi:hypothetical protein
MRSRNKWHYQSKNSLWKKKENKNEEEEEKKDAVVATRI